MDLMCFNENYAFLIAIHVTVPFEDFRWKVNNTTALRNKSGAKIFIENEKTIDPANNIIKKRFRKKLILIMYLWK